METFSYYFFLSLFTLLLLPFFAFSLKRKKQLNLPPGPPAWPIVGNLLQLKNSADGTFSGYVAQLRKKYGPIVTIRMGSRSLIMIASHELAHEALVEKGSVLANRPPVHGIRKLFTSNGHSVNSSAYGSLWRTLRRNLVNETLSPKSMSSSLFAEARQWGLEVLFQELRNEAALNKGIVRNVMEHLRFAMSCILLKMCFGSRTDDQVARDVLSLMRELIVNGGGLLISDAFPVLGMFLRKRWNMMLRLRQRQIDGLLPLIRKRREELGNGAVPGAYVDSLFALTVDDGRWLSDKEVVTLCSEFLNAGTDTTATCLQWVLANLVLHQDVQAKLHDEIVGALGKEERVVREDDVGKMRYLNAVVKETLRRHPPGAVLLFHGATKPCSVGGYDIPMDATVNFDVAGIGRDPRVWEKALKFKPERFMVGDVDVEAKMIPFGVGRRICPGMGLAVLHLNLIVAALVQAFQWESVEGETVDLTEKEEFTTLMKHPLHAVLKERFQA